MGLNTDQAAGEAAFETFKRSDASIFALLGYAGTGKSYMTAHLLQEHILGEARRPTHRHVPAGSPFDDFLDAAEPTGGGETLIACPTHKAMNIVRRFLSEVDIEFELGYDKFHHRYGTPVTGTTAQLIGIRPIVSDKQTAKKMVFGKVDRGVVEKMGGVSWVIIDEVSMLSAADLRALEQLAGEVGFKVLIVGDPGQLPPVEAEAIDFNAIEHRAVLETIMRQQGDSAIPHLAKAIRDLTNWKKVTGPGVDHFENPAGAFIDELDGPPAEDERERAVFIAYRNTRVNAVQQAACMKVYGHGRLEVAPGEVMVASTPLLKPGSRVPIQLCNNGDVLVIEDIGGMGQWGIEVQVKRVSTGNVFTTEFLDEKQLGNPNHHYNVELRAREKRAQELQKAFNKGDRSVDSRRREAWVDFFQLKNSAILSAAHPFAITSHKSQGSTYRQVFVDAQDMKGFDHRALYVGATRPSEELIIG